MKPPTQASGIRRLWQKIKPNLFTGTFILAPAVVTIFLLWKSFEFLDGILATAMNTILRAIVGRDFLGGATIPGLGLIALFFLLTLTGFMARNVLGQWFFKKSRQVINQIPLVNRVYLAIEQIGQAVFTGKREVFKRAVLIEYPRPGLFCIAIMTADTSGQIQDSLPEDTISVFLPTTPNPTSGFLLFVPKKDVIPLDMPVEDALKLVISGGALSALYEKHALPK